MATVQPRKIRKAFAAWLDTDTFKEESLSTPHRRQMAPKKKRALQLSKLYSFACGMSPASHSDDMNDGNTESGGFSRVVHCNHPDRSPDCMLAYSDCSLQPYKSYFTSALCCGSKHGEGGNRRLEAILAGILAGIWNGDEVMGRFAFADGGMAEN
ncbi:hypothetical protein GOP47_0026748 [Adiantum capillus-veneris]|nr:hypothetical protein GOP47_0026748 [Adiantum capillus-veneris]